MKISHKPGQCMNTDYLFTDLNLFMNSSCDGMIMWFPIDSHIRKKVWIGNELGIVVFEEPRKE